MRKRGVFEMRGRIEEINRRSFDSLTLRARSLRMTSVNLLPKPERKGRTR
jgi:hypothetical protein